ncbi:MAG: GAF domain-containing sensor histidine kinase [Pseudanabaenaceae cyanobacterium SKYGB_i_bin29]|nr:GAF domain-containing sensor histidine kinase [Pseudanabaenaceae cyanobacterium SKYG29]MDW8420732.1 GAF domain-containing sensor histidine kinase [Pseudanabaenaceae cyanobacterium SKYGB_i_bin29]
MFTASPDLEAIVQAQLLLAVQSLGLLSAVLYLAQTTPEGTSQWVELASYPQDKPALPPDRDSHLSQGRLIVPLVYEEGILGLLVSEKEKGWTAAEQQQIEAIGRTLAIACALDQRYQWLLQQQKQERDLLANLLHQLKNPVTAIRTFAQLLVKRILPSDPNHSLAKGIVRETVHLQELLGEVKQTPLLSPAATSLLLPPAPINLTEVLEPIATSFASLAHSKGLQFTTLLPKDPVLVKAHPSALREAIGNILDNAIKYTPPGGNVTLTVAVTNHHCQIVVEDTGIGISTADLPHVFQRHFRSDKVNKEIEGSGLGLAIAKQLLEQIGGTIGIDSTEGVGTQVTIQLPKA